MCVITKPKNRKLNIITAPSAQLPLAVRMVLTLFGWSPASTHKDEIRHRHGFNAAKHRTTDAYLVKCLGLFLKGLLDGSFGSAATGLDMHPSQVDQFNAANIGNEKVDSLPLESKLASLRLYNKQWEQQLRAAKQAQAVTSSTSSRSSSSSSSTSSSKSTAAAAAQRSKEQAFSNMVEELIDWDPSSAVASLIKQKFKPEDVTHLKHVLPALCQTVRNALLLRWEQVVEERELELEMEREESQESDGYEDDAMEAADQPEAAEANEVKDDLDVDLDVDLEPEAKDQPKSRFSKVEESVRQGLRFIQNKQQVSGSEVTAIDWKRTLGKWRSRLDKEDTDMRQTMPSDMKQVQDRFALTRIRELEIHAFRLCCELSQLQAYSNNTQIRELAKLVREHCKHTHEPLNKKPKKWNIPESVWRRVRSELVVWTPSCDLLLGCSSFLRMHR